MQGSQVSGLLDCISLVCMTNVLADKPWEASVFNDLNKKDHFSQYFFLHYFGCAIL